MKKRKKKGDMSDSTVLLTGVGIFLALVRPCLFSPSHSVSCHVLYTIM